MPDRLRLRTRGGSGGYVLEPFTNISDGGDDPASMPTDISDGGSEPSAMPANLSIGPTFVRED